MQRRQGRFELAHSGTIFLDEIGELPAETQIALLRVIQERQFERVGGSRPITTDVRIIAATNRDLPAAIAAGTFRADLFYRLNVFPIDVPPLRQRKEDIPMLVEYFVRRYADKARKHFSKIDKNTLKLCQSYYGLEKQPANPFLDAGAHRCGSNDFPEESIGSTTLREDPEPYRSTVGSRKPLFVCRTVATAVRLRCAPSLDLISPTDGSTYRCFIQTRHQIHLLQQPILKQSRSS
jgi:hypothetical protein